MTEKTVLKEEISPGKVRMDCSGWVKFFWREGRLQRPEPPPGGAAVRGKRGERSAEIGNEGRGGEGRGAPRPGMRGGEGSPETGKDGRGAPKPALAAGAGALSGRKLRNKWLLFFPCWPSAGEFLSQWSISVDMGWQKGKFPNSVYFN